MSGWYARIPTLENDMEKARAVLGFVGIRSAYLSKPYVKSAL